MREGVTILDHVRSLGAVLNGLERSHSLGLGLGVAAGLDVEMVGQDLAHLDTI